MTARNGRISVDEVRAFASGKSVKLSGKQVSRILAYIPTDLPIAVHKDKDGWYHMVSLRRVEGGVFAATSILGYPPAPVGDNVRELEEAIKRLLG